ncbi:hypothetical protein AgCh_023796 [Apium graveolens]
MYNSKYKGQDKLPVIMWVVAQACQGDLAVGWETRPKSTNKGLGFTVSGKAENLRRSLFVVAVTEISMKSENLLSCSAT